MAISSDFSWDPYSTGILVITMTPPTPIGGWSIQATFGYRFGGSGRVTKYASSGFSGVSGISILNSGLGIFSVEINVQDNSGLDFGNYAYWTRKTDVGSEVEITNGYQILVP